MSYLDTIFGKSPKDRLDMYQDQQPLLSRLSDAEHPTSYAPIRDSPVTHHPSNNLMRSRKWRLSLVSCCIALLIFSATFWSGRNYYKSHRVPVIAPVKPLDNNLTR